VLLDRGDAVLDHDGVVADDFDLVAGGSDFWTSARRARIAFTTATVFSPDCLRTESTTEGRRSSWRR